MAMQTNLEALIQAAKHLSDRERKQLAEALHPRSDSAPPRHITEIGGLGKDCGKELIRKIISMRIGTRGTTNAASRRKARGLDRGPLIYYIEQHPDYLSSVDELFGALDSRAAQAKHSR